MCVCVSRLSLSLVLRCCPSPAQECGSCRWANLMGVNRWCFDRFWHFGNRWCACERLTMYTPTLHIGVNQLSITSSFCDLIHNYQIKWGGVEEDLFQELALLIWSFLYSRKKKTSVKHKQLSFHNVNNFWHTVHTNSSWNKENESKQSEKATLKPDVVKGCFHLALGAAFKSTLKASAYKSRQGDVRLWKQGFNKGSYVSWLRRTWHTGSWSMRGGKIQHDTNRLGVKKHKTKYHRHYTLSIHLIMESPDIKP